ncbi:hypothetical protein GALMADRAFT_1328284, partial [Galerina marginata CBS 339.88]
RHSFDLFLICRQNPQVVGHNKDRIVFDNKVAETVEVHHSYTLRLDQKGQYILDAGVVNGVCPGSEFTIYADRGGLLRLPNLGVIVPYKFHPFRTIMGRLSGPDPTLDKAAFAIQTRTGALAELKVFISPDMPLLPDFVGMQSITIVDDPSVAHLVVERENDETAFVILDKRLTAHGIAKYAHKAKADDMITVLQGAAHYYYHLNRSYLTSKYIEKGIEMEFFKLDESTDQYDEDTLPLASRLSGENLLKDGVITLSLRDDVDDIYGIRITNTSGLDLYPSIFYFNNRELSISTTNFQVDSPLPKHGGTLNLGFGYGYRKGYQYFMPSGLDVDVGFLKCFFPTSPVDLSNIATLSVNLSDITALSVDLSNVDSSQTATSPVGPPQTATSPVDLPNVFQKPVSILKSSGKGRLPMRLYDAWGCIVIPVVQRRVKIVA